MWCHVWDFDDPSCSGSKKPANASNPTGDPYSCDNAIATSSLADSKKAGAPQRLITCLTREATELDCLPVPSKDTLAATLWLLSARSIASEQFFAYILHPPGALPINLVGTFWPDSLAALPSGPTDDNRAPICSGSTPILASSDPWRSSGERLHRSVKQNFNCPD